MTTIASDGKTVAVDGLRVCGSEIIDLDTPKIGQGDDCVYGFAGAARYFEPALRWHVLRGEENPPPHPGRSADQSERWSLFVFTPGQVVRYSSDDEWPEAYPYPAAFGSGGVYAQAALLSGKTSREAVEIAAKLDIYTGGTISELTIPGAS